MLKSVLPAILTFATLLGSPGTAQTCSGNDCQFSLPTPPTSGTVSIVYVEAKSGMGRDEHEPCAPCLPCRAKVKVTNNSPNNGITVGEPVSSPPPLSPPASHETLPPDKSTTITLVTDCNDTKVNENTALSYYVELTSGLFTFGGTVNLTCPCID